MDHVDAHLVVRELLERLAHGLDGALHVGLDDDLQLLHIAHLHLLEQVVERDLRAGIEALLFLGGAALFDELAGQAFIRNGIERVAAGRHAVEARNFDRHARAGVVDRAPARVRHRAHTADARARNHNIARMQRAVLHEHRRDRPAAAVEARFHHRALGRAVRVCLQFLHIRNEQDHLQEVLQALARLRGDADARRVAAPFLRHKLVFRQLLQDMVRVGAGLIDLIDCDDDRDLRGLRMVDGLDGLRHDAVVRRHNEHGDIRALCAAGTHRRKRLMARRVEEGDRPAGNVDLVRADVLRNAAGLARGHVRVADCVEQTRLAVVDVAHDHDNRRARQKVFRFVLAVVDDLLLNRDLDFLFHLRVEFHRDERRGVKIDFVVDRRKHAHRHELLDDLGGRRLQTQREFTDRNALGDLDRNRLCLAFRCDAAQALSLGLALRAASAAVLGALLV